MIKDIKGASSIVSRRDRSDMRSIIAFQAGSKIRDTGDEKVLNKLGVDIIGMFDIIRQLKDAFRINMPDDRVYASVNERSTVGEVLDFMSRQIETDEIAIQAKLLVIEKKLEELQKKTDLLKKRERELIVMFMIQKCKT